MEGLDTVRARYAGKGFLEWERLTATPITRIEHLITSHWLQRYLPPSGMVLDAGSGPGRYAIDLAIRGYRVVMFDLLCEMLRLGRQKAAQAGVGPRLVTPTEGDLAALPYEDSAFDAVISLGAPLSHITDADTRFRAVAEMARVVKPGRPVFLTVCTRLAAYRGIAFWMDLGFFDQMTTAEARKRGVFDGSQLWYTFEPGELEGMAQHAGLDVIERVGCEGLANHLPMDHLEQIERDPQRWPVWREILLETCDEPTIIGISNHLMVVARKPA